jgi:hypothetical protein
MLTRLASLQIGVGLILISWVQGRTFAEDPSRGPGSETKSAEQLVFRGPKGRIL